MNPVSTSPDDRRRLLLLRTAGVAATFMALAACGGGGGGDALTPPAPGPGPAPGPAPGPQPPSPPPPPPPSGNWAPTGVLAYRNTARLGIYDHATGREAVVNLGERVNTDAGVAVSRQGIVTALERSGRDSWRILLFNRQGAEQERFAVDRELAFPTSPVMISTDGTLMAFSIDEPASATSGTRVARTLVVRRANASLAAIIDGYARPLWLGTDGSLLLEHAGTHALHRFDSQYDNRGALPNLTVERFDGSFAASSDGRSVAYTAEGKVRIRDLQTGADRLAAQSDNGVQLMTPVFSPDGRGLAVLNYNLVTFKPHVVQLGSGTTVVRNANELPGNTVTEVRGAIGWGGA